MKKLVSLLLALCLVFALGASAFAASFPANGFSDVSRSAWYAEAVALTAGIATRWSGA